MGFFGKEKVVYKKNRQFLSSQSLSHLLSLLKNWIKSFLINTPMLYIYKAICYWSEKYLIYAWLSIVSVAIYIHLIYSVLWEKEASLHALS